MPITMLSPNPCLSPPLPSHLFRLMLEDFPFFPDTLDPPPLEKDEQQKYHSLRIYPYPMVWPPFETMVSIPLWAQKTLEIKGLLGLERRFLDLVSQTPRPRGRGRPLFAEKIISEIQPRSLCRFASLSPAPTRAQNPQNRLKRVSGLKNSDMSCVRDNGGLLHLHPVHVDDSLALTSLAFTYLFGLSSARFL